MEAADKMVDVIRDIIQQELDKLDRVILCEIIDQVDANHYNVCVVPDRDATVYSVPNMTKFDFTPGEYCYVYKIQNNLAKYDGTNTLIQEYINDANYLPLGYDKKVIVVDNCYYFLFHNTSSYME